MPDFQNPWVPGGTHYAPASPYAPPPPGGGAPGPALPATDNPWAARYAGEYLAEYGPALVEVGDEAYLPDFSRANYATGRVPDFARRATGIREVYGAGGLRYVPTEEEMLTQQLITLAVIAVSIAAPYALAALSAKLGIAGGTAAGSGTAGSTSSVFRLVDLAPKAGAAASPAPPNFFTKLGKLASGVFKGKGVAPVVKEAVKEGGPKYRPWPRHGGSGLSTAKSAKAAKAAKAAKKAAKAAKKADRVAKGIETARAAKAVSPAVGKAAAASAAADALTPRTSRRQLRQQERALRQEMGPSQGQPPRVDPEPYVHELQNQVQRGELTIGSFLDRLQQPELLALAGEGAQALRGIRQVITTQWQQARALPNPWSGGTAPALQPPVRLPDLSPWRELLNFELPPEAKAELERRNKQRTFYFKGIPIVPSEFYEHTLEDAYGPVNLDYYPVEIYVKPKLNGREMSAEEFLEYFRRHINQAVNPADAHFNPYTQADKEKWLSSDPTNAIFSIPLGSLYEFEDEPVRGLLSDPYVRPDHGAVIVSEVTPRRFRFTTIATHNDWAHAVSGTREFGVIPTATGYIIYTKGSDRPTNPYDITVETGTSLWNSFFYGRHVGAVFGGGDALWSAMQEGLVKLVESKELNGKARVLKSQTVSRRYDWESVKQKYIRRRR